MGGTCNYRRIGMMKFLTASAAVLGMGLGLSGVHTAEAKGCLKGAAVGGLAGHALGHGAVGAAGGCAVGHHEANKKEKQQDQAAAANTKEQPANGSTSGTHTGANGSNGGSGQ